MDPSIPGWEQIAVPLLARDGYVVLRIRGGSVDDDDGSSSLAPQADVAEIIKYAQQQQQQQQQGGGAGAGAGGAEAAERGKGYQPCR